MYIMRRRAIVAGLAGLEYATTITEVVQAAGVPVSMWIGGVGTVPGSVAWSVPVESVAQWAAYSDALLADATYRERSAVGREFIESMEADELMQIVHGEIDRPAEVGQYVTSVEATMHPERSAQAAAFAPEVAAAWSEVTGLPALVATNAAGSMNTISWLARHDDAASIDAANAAIAASSDYAEVLAKGDGLFTSGTHAFARRAA